MVRKLYMLLMFGLGALFVWSLLADDRKRAQMAREQDDMLRKLNAESEMRSAMFEAVYGPSRVSREEVEDELRRFEENPNWMDEEIEEDENYG
ncbi:MAG: hypothetical protein AAF787_24050 [Chloroflexota bacterium]